MSDLRDDLLDIPNVGPATADEIEAAIEARDTAGVPDAVGEALDYLDAGQPGYAAKFLRRVVE